MEDTLYREKYDKRKKRNKNSGTSIWIKVLLFIISLGIWCGIVYYGFIYAKEYIDTSINNVQQSNIMAVEQLKEEVKIVNSEINRLRIEIQDLKEEVRDTDSTLDNTNSIQEDIDKRLKYLDEKLIELQESLRILEGAPNVKN